VLLREAAEALSRVQRELLARNLSLKVYDCYRPRRAVRTFVGFVKDGAGAAPDPRLKRFHPNVARSRLIEDGYVAAVSQHSRGDTVDITLVELPAQPLAPFSLRAVYGACTGPAGARAPDSGVDMGTGYDCFDPLSHTNTADITAAQPPTLTGERVENSPSGEPLPRPAGQSPSSCRAVPANFAVAGCP
jgi:D-alanyl-D-alanine dipeptidase